MSQVAARRLVLVGGGHAQVHVLADLARAPLAGVEVTLVHPGRVALYTGMIPGVVAGLYAVDEAAIDVAGLAAACGARHVDDRVVAVHRDAKVVETARGARLPYDVLALDVGARPRGSEAAATCAHVVPIKPMEEAAPRITAALEAAPEDATAAVVGGGAGGVELAFALRRRLPDAARVLLLERGARLLPEAPDRLRRTLARLFARAGIEVVLDAGTVEATPLGIATQGGRVLRTDLVVWATGAAGWPFLARSGLACDEHGFAWVDDFLRCRGGDDVFAAGDASRLASAPWVPRAGVHAVRQGPVLAHNLRVALGAADALRPFRPQRRFLKLLNTADRRALASWGALATHGRVWWWLKDAIDRRFVGRYRRVVAAARS